MKAYDFDACVYQGDVYCNECLPRGLSVNSEEVQPIFASDEWDYTPVCCQCMEKHDYIQVLYPHKDGCTTEGPRETLPCNQCGVPHDLNDLDSDGYCPECCLEYYSL